MLGDAHEAFLLALFLGEEGRDAALPRLRHAGDQRPVDLARRARAEGLGERGRGEARLGDQQAARRVLVEPVHQPRPLAVHAGLAQHLQHAVEMARGARAALHREAHRLVEHQHVVVLVQDDRLEEARASSRPRASAATTSAALTLSGGMRTGWPASSRSFGSARLPFTLTSPLRMMRWMWLNDSPGNRASKKRSSRMPDSSGLTVTVCTPVATCGAGAAAHRRRGRALRRRRSARASSVERGAAAGARSTGRRRRARGLRS